MIRTFTLLATLAALSGTTSAADIEKAEKAAKAFLEKAKAQAMPVHVADEEVASSFGKQTVFAVRFQQFPVAMAPAEGFEANNILFVTEKGETKLVSKGGDLLKIFEKMPALTDKIALTNVKALLALEREMIQDGFYKFKPVDDSFKVTREGTRTTAKGTIDVTEGGTGSITVMLVYEKDGSLFGSSVGPFVKPGPRPRRLGD